MLVKYYLSDNIKATFENFAFGLRNAWTGPAKMPSTSGLSFLYHRFSKNLLQRTHWLDFEYTEI